MVRRKTTEKNGSDLNYRQTMDITAADVANDDKQVFDRDNMNIEEEFKKLYEKAIKLGLSDEDFAKMEVLQDIRWKASYWRILLRGFGVFLIIAAVLFYSLIVIFFLDWPIRREGLLQFWFGMHGSDPDLEPCLVDMPETVTEMFRPPVECSFCENLTSVKTVYNISQEEFEELYAYTGVPVIIGDGTVNWTAPQHFSFEFFKDIYKVGSPILDNHERNCQFFPYKTSFTSLADVMSMSRDRASLADGSEPWYIGWSNCDFSAANTLRKHYQRPYFLPELSESSKTDWVFMGSPGYGAHMHIDNVGNPSWQAQITGTKRWTLEPPPECYYTCADRVEVTVKPGQIIVLDTNIWFHSTLNVGDDISITIGSEFD